MSNSVRPQRRQPTRLPRPWDSPGKNTGVGCHFLVQCMEVKSQSEVAQSCLTLCDPMDCSLPGSSIHGIFQARVLEWGAIAFSDVAIQLINNVVLASDVQQSDSFIYIHVSESESRSVVSDSLGLRGLYSPQNSPGQNTRVGSLSLFQGIFPTQGFFKFFSHLGCFIILSRVHCAIQ